MPVGSPITCRMASTTEDSCEEATALSTTLDHWTCRSPDQRHLRVDNAFGLTQAVVLDLAGCLLRGVLQAGGIDHEVRSLHVTLLGLVRDHCVEITHELCSF